MNPGGCLRMAVISVFVLSTPATAQSVPTGELWSHGTTISLLAGVASASSDTGPLAGGAAGWEITPRFGLEGSVAWLDRAGAAEAFSAAFTAHATLTAARPAVPFIRGGVGLYRASFAAADEMPDFYRRRLLAPASAFGMPRSFTDPSFVLGGGVNVFASRHLAIRPEIEAIVVRRNSRSHIVTAVTMHVAYHFEDHPITPAPQRK